MRGPNYLNSNSSSVSLPNWCQYLSQPHHSHPIWIWITTTLQFLYISPSWKIYTVCPNQQQLLFTYKNYINGLVICGAFRQIFLSFFSFFLLLCPISLFLIFKHFSLYFSSNIEFHFFFGWIEWNRSLVDVFHPY